MHLPPFTTDGSRRPTNEPLPRRTSGAHKLAALFAFALFVSAYAFAQTTKAPYPKDRLLRVVELNALSTQEIVSYIERRGVDFELNKATEAEFARAGARPEVIAAIRANFRRAGSPAPAADPNAAPLAPAEIVAMLKARTPESKVEDQIKRRGVSFRLDAGHARSIRLAGGTNATLGAISANFKEPAARPTAPASANAPASRAAANAYDDLTDKAIEANKLKRYDEALALLDQAIKLDAAQPAAHQLAGFVRLYGKSDIEAAEREMRLAIERGGSAAFRVFHDHGSGTFADTCAGSLFVSRKLVTFKADDGEHTFGTQDAEIDEIGTNRIIGKLFGGGGGAFHIKVDGDRNYNFAPLTKKSAESKLIIELVEGYK